MERQRICMTIDLDALLHNIREIRSHLDPVTALWAVIKCDAYGHGAAPIARFLEDQDAVFGFALATVDEARELRSFGIKKPLLVLGFTNEEEYASMINQDIMPTLFSLPMARAFSHAAIECGKSGLFHLKVDTGMGRIGLPATTEGVEEAAAMCGLPQISAHGIFTHFAKADEADKTAAQAQFAAFSSFCEQLSARGISIPMRHCANSAAILEMNGTHMDAVRAGIILYGLWPSDEVGHDTSLQPVMSLHSHIVHLKTVPEGTPIGYGGTYQTSGTRRIATIPVGYGDGYARSLSNCGSVLIHGKRAPIVGRICMDQMMADVTDIADVQLQDRVTLLGTDGDETITLEELGDRSGRFNYEFACDLGTRRIPREFRCAGRTVDVVERL